MAFLSTFIVGFFVTPLIVQRLGHEAYGFVGLSNDVLGYVGLIAIAWNSTAGRFVAFSIYNQQPTDAKKFYVTTLYANVALALITFPLFALLVYFFDSVFHVPVSLQGDVRWLLSFSILSFYLSLLSATFGVSFFVSNKLHKGSLRSVETSILKVAILLGGIYLIEPSLMLLGFSGFVCAFTQPRGTIEVLSQFCHCTLVI